MLKMVTFGSVAADLTYTAVTLLQSGVGDPTSVALLAVASLLSVWGLSSALRGFVNPDPASPEFAEDRTR